MFTFPLPNVASVLSLWYPSIFEKAKEPEVIFDVVVSFPCLSFVLPIPTVAPTLKLLFEL